MKIKSIFGNSSNLLLLLTLIWTTVLFLIGAWWGYLLININERQFGSEHLKLSKMVFWEGSSFLILIILISTSFLILYFKDLKRNTSIQAFFASLTHELKTPLASIRLQAEVIDDILSKKSDPSLMKLSGRLIEDTVKLEIQMDKILQLARLERGGELNLTTIKLIPFIRNSIKKWGKDIDLKIIDRSKDPTIIADEFALELIFKNLYENTRLHSKSKQVDIVIDETGNRICLLYADHGEFSGDIKKLGTLFYKHNSSKGSGIGLYLSRKLLSKMNGEINFINENGLKFQLYFTSGSDYNA